MNLPAILPRFVISHCNGCPHHAPVGDPSWGRGILADHERREKERSEIEKESSRTLNNLRERLRSLPAAALATSDITERRILEWIEQLFAQSTLASSAIANLSGSVSVAHDLFGEPAIAALIEGSKNEPFREDCLTVLVPLAEYRTDLNERLRAVAVDALRAGQCLEKACAILVPPNLPAQRLDDDLVAIVIGLQDHNRPFGGWQIRNPEFPLVDIPPNYAASTRFLVQAFDASHDSVLNPLRVGLHTDDKHRRVNVCGVIQQVMAQRLDVLRLLTDDLLASLEFDDDVYGESADREAAKLLARIYLLDPETLDSRLAAEITNKSTEIQIAWVSVYEQVFRFGKYSQCGAGDPNSAELRFGQEVALHRCLNWLSEDSLELETRSEVADAIRNACNCCPDVVLPAFDQLFGVAAQLSICEQVPAPRPRLILPGEPPTPPELIAIQKQNQQMLWRQFKTQVEGCLKEFVEERPTETVDRLVAFFSNLDTRTHERFKATVLTLLGKAGEDPRCRPLVLPALWIGLMDYGSVLIRGVAIQALQACFRYSSSKPPANMVEILLVNLKDSYRLIHQSVLDILARNTDWLTDAQVQVALDLACGWALTYRNERRPYDLERPIELALSLSRRLPSHRHSVVSWLSGLLPNDGDVFDQKLLDEFVWKVSPQERGAGLIAIRLGEWLGGQTWEPFANDDDRIRWFVWMNQLSHSEFREAEPSLRASALRAAEQNPYMTCLFAGVFASFGRFATEAEIVSAARAILPDGRLHAQLSERLDAIRKAAEENVQRSRCDYTNRD